MIDGAVDHVEIVLDAGVGGLGGRTDPVQRVGALMPGLKDRAHLALLRRIVDDAGVVTRLGREHQDRTVREA